MLRISHARSLADFERLERLLVAYERDLPEELRHGQVADAHALRATYAGRSGAFLALLDGEPAGCVAVRQMDGATAMLLRLFVRPERRGIGAARALVEAALDFARKRGYARIVLDTEKRRLQKAYELYRCFGFRECDAYAGVNYRCPTFMELQLASESASRRSDSNR